MQSFLIDHNNRRYELTSIFPGGIQPFTLPTPGGPHFVKKVTANENEWSHEYRTGIEVLRKKLLNSTFIPTSKAQYPRQWTNLAAWRQRLSLAFNEDIGNILKGRYQRQMLLILP